MLATFDVVVYGSDVEIPRDCGLADTTTEEKQAYAWALGRPVRFLETLES